MGPVDAAASLATSDLTTPRDGDEPTTRDEGTRRCALDDCRRPHDRRDARGEPALYCSDPCRAKAHHRAQRANPKRAAAAVARCARWYEDNASLQCWRTALKRAGLASDERMAVVERLRGRGHIEPAAVRLMFEVAGCALPAPRSASRPSTAPTTSAAPTAAPPAPPPAAPDEGPELELDAAPVDALDPFELPSPDAHFDFGAHLPGAACELTIRTLGGAPVPFGIEHGRMLHGLLTALTGAPHDELPRWALRPWERGWAVVWRRAEHAALVARTCDAVWGAERVRVTFGPATRLRVPPRRAPGRYLARVSTITPVVCREDSRAGGYRRGRPRPEHIAASLRRLALALGADVPRAEIAVSILWGETDVTETNLAFSGGGGGLGGKWGPGGRLPGWSGAVIVECNAVARWLLDVAARGWGLGGKVAAGFGRVQVEDTTRETLAALLERRGGRSVRTTPVSSLRERTRFYVEGVTDAR